MFELLKEKYLQDRENRKEENRFYIENGFCKNWNDKTASDEGLKRYSTETRWNQFITGSINREKAVEYAVKRMEKAIDKEIAATLEKMERIATAPDLEYISVYVEYRKNYTWGYCPAVTIYTNNGSFSGYASGYGYDKESAAVAEAFNKDLSILKTLYSIKEEGLKRGLSDYSRTACTGVDNRNICGYGSGYGVLPYFEGGVGVSCFWEILKKAGFRTKCDYSRKHSNYYNVAKEG